MPSFFDQSDERTPIPIARIEDDPSSAILPGQGGQGGGEDNGGIGAAVQNTTSYLGEMGERKKQQDMEAQTVVQTNSSTGMSQITMPTELFRQSAEKTRAYDHIAALYDQDIQRIEAERAQRAKRPWANVLATIAGQMAAGDVNPVTAGLGRAALQLNPSDQTLRERERPLLEARARLGVEQEREAAVDRRLAVQEANVERRFQISEAATKAREAGQVFRSLNSDAMKGYLNNPELISQSLQSTDMPKDKADAMAQQLAAVSKESQQAQAAQAAAKDERERREWTERAREADNRVAAMLKAAEIRANQAERNQEMKLEADKAKAAGKELEVPKTVPEKLANLTAAEKSLDRVADVIDKYGKWMGPVAGRTAAPIAGYFSKELSRAQANVKLEVAQAIKSTGAGARGFSQNERQYFDALATAFTMSPERAKGVVDAWRDYIKQNRQGYFEAYKGLRDKPDTYSRAFGKDADDLYGTETVIGPDGKIVPKGQ